MVDVLITALQTLRTRRGSVITGNAEPAAHLVAESAAGSDNYGG